MPCFLDTVNRRLAWVRTLPARSVVALDAAGLEDVIERNDGACDSESAVSMYHASANLKRNHVAVIAAEPVLASTTARE